MKLHIYIPDDVYKALKKQAKEEQRSISNLIRKYCLSGLVAEAAKDKRKAVA